MKNQKQQKKILLVEDDTSIADILKKKLSKENFTVLIAENGQAGLEKALSHKPDLILLDIVLPVMDGMTMLQKLRAEKAGESIPVIILTNLTLDPDRMSLAGQYQAAAYLVKADWNIDNLVTKVKETLEQV